VRVGTDGGDVGGPARGRRRARRPTRRGRRRRSRAGTTSGAGCGRGSDEIDHLHAHQLGRQGVGGATADLTGTAAPLTGGIELTDVEGSEDACLVARVDNAPAAGVTYQLAGNP